MFTFAELFAGVGGFGVACEALGGRCVFASEIEPNARKGWLANFRREVLVGDIKQVASENIPDHDVLLGGFPCQPFSKAGLQPALDTADGQLYLQVIRLLRDRQPRMVLLENVPGLLSASNGEALTQIVADIERCGYGVTCGIIDSACLVPQHRKRLYIVGFLKSAVNEPSLFRWPQLPDLVKLRRRVGDILEPSDSPHVLASRLSLEQWSKRLKCEPDRSKWFIQADAPGPTLTRGYRKAGGEAAGKRYASKRHQHAQSGAGAHDIPWRDGFWHNLVACEGDADQLKAPARFLTARECARMHGFPEKFVIPQENDASGPGVSLFGNAVSPPVVAAILHAMLSFASQVPSLSFNTPRSLLGIEEQMLSEAMASVEKGSSLVSLLRNVEWRDAHIDCTPGQQQSTSPIVKRQRPEA